MSKRACVEIGGSENICAALHYWENNCGRDMYQCLRCSYFKVGFSSQSSTKITYLDKSWHLLLLK